MTLSNLAAIGNFVSGVAIVVTLVFLLMQMRQTNRNQRSLMQQGRTARVSETILRCTEPFLSEAMVRGFRGDITMEPAQIQAFYTKQERSIRRAGTRTLLPCESSFFIPVSALLGGSIVTS